MLLLVVVVVGDLKVFSSFAKCIMQNGAKDCKEIYASLTELCKCKRNVTVPNDKFMEYLAEVKHC